GPVELRDGDEQRRRGCGAEFRAPRAPLHHRAVVECPILRKGSAMKAMTWMSVALAFAVACKKGEDKAEPPPKVVDKPKPEPAKPAAPADVPVTSKSPEAVKAFEQGRALVDNALAGESPEHFKKAIELDPDFAQAHAYLGSVTPGAAGTESLTKAGA